MVQCSLAMWLAWLYIYWQPHTFNGLNIVRGLPPTFPHLSACPHLCAFHEILS